MSFFRDRAVLVCGGAGFIGSRFAADLVAEGAKVTVLDRLSYAGGRDNVPEGAAFVHGDVCDAALLADVVPGHGIVVNFAAESHVDRSIETPEVFTRTNVLGAQTLFDACLLGGVTRVVQVSTDEVYGSIADGSWSEDAPVMPSSPYSASKAAADLMALAYARTYGLPVSITRSANTYGPRQHPEKLIPRFVTNLLTGLKLPLYGDGRNVREWLHVADHSRAVRLVAEGGEPGTVYHVPGSVELTNREVTERVLAEMHADWSAVEHVADRKGHDLRYSLADNRLAALGYRPGVDFGRGLAETVRWYRDNEAWWKRRL